jgi:hypothetical protein
MYIIHHVAIMNASLEGYGLSGKHHVRDLWAHQDRGSQKDQFWYEVPSHGVVLLRVK